MVGYKCVDMKHKLFSSTQNEVRNEGVIYPGYVELVVQANGSTICPNVTAADTSCSVDLPRDIYNISIIQSTEFASTLNTYVIDSELSNTFKLPNWLHFSCSKDTDYKGRIQT